MPTNFPTQQQMNAFEHSVHSFLVVLPRITAIAVGLMVIACLFVLIIRFILVSLYFRALTLRKSVLFELTPLAFADKPPLATVQLFHDWHGLDVVRSSQDKLLHRPALFTLEVMSTREGGTRFFLRCAARDKQNFAQELAAYAAELRFKEVDDYLLDKQMHSQSKISVFKQVGRSFAYPMQHHDSPAEYDPATRLTGALANPQQDETVIVQYVISPATVREADWLSERLLYNKEHAATLGRRKSFGRMLANSLSSLLLGMTETIGEIHHGSSGYKKAPSQNAVDAGLKPYRTLSVFEQAELGDAKTKVDDLLFLASIRVLVASKSKERLRSRTVAVRKALHALGTKRQSLRAVADFPYALRAACREFAFRYRLPALSSKNVAILSATELATMYHFPRSEAAIDGVVSIRSRTLEAPLALKQRTDHHSFDVVLGRNYHHGHSTDIGLTTSERESHVYVVGGTGNGKTTMLEYAILQDIRSGKGIAVIDPHGDSARRLLRYIPENRMQDVIYFNPRDYDFPVGLNLLELPEGLSGSELAHQKDLVTEAVISVLSKIFDDNADTNAYRIERVMRNAIHTAFTIKDATLFTVLRLLTESSYRHAMTRNLQDERLRRFWKEELGKAGEFQRVKISGGPVTRIERFESSESAKRVLGQTKSTINFEDIMNTGKILICNFSKGSIGEDTSTLFGTTVLAKLQLAAWRREELPQSERRPFYLYVDEFQNFATTSFMDLFSEARKYKLFVTIAHQSVSQLKDPAALNTILDNVGTVVAFRSKSKPTEDLLLHQFSPRIVQGDIPNLPRYHFYIKITANEPQEATSGETLLLGDNGSDTAAERAIAVSREQYATPYEDEETKERGEDVAPPSEDELPDDGSAVVQ
ncbi:MAG TPA: type IV secretion system DNA-binding domain-containing protein [Candidatus Saccharimonadales bacterium]|nr:type IV secretion system DNA-binding domain-containing protein [Candidatus Saccharimonadales bacterium]